MCVKREKAERGFCHDVVRERDREGSREREREKKEDAIADADLATGTTRTGFSSRTEVGQTLFVALLSRPR